MARTYALSDESVVVVIGSGAGGGTVANELAQRGIDVVCLEAGTRLTLADVENDFGVMYGKMGWHDPRRGVPAWICKTVGGTTMRWSGITPRFRDFESKPDWPRPKSDPAHANRVEITGSPNIVQETVIADERTGDGNAGGCLSTGMRAVHAIPAVCASRR